MRVIYGLMVWFLLTPVGFASTPQKHATPADALVHEARLLWNRGEKKQAVEKVRQAVAVDAKPYALSRYLNSAIQAGDTDQFAMLVEAGARAGKDNDEFLLYLVSQRVNPTVAMVELLLSKGARLNQPVKYKSALMHAVSEGHFDIANLLLARGEDVNTQTDEGTALMMAVRRGNPQMVQLLLYNGARVNVKHRSGNTPLIMSADLSFAEMNAKAGEPPPVSSAEVMSLLLANGGDANAVGQYGRTALMEASSAAKVRLLLARGTDVNVKDEDGATALTRAVDRADVEVVEALLKAGAEGLNAQNADGETLLMRAVRAGKTDLARLLLASGADPSLVDVLGDTVTILAYEKGLSEIEALSRGARPVEPTPAVRNAWLRAAVAKKDEPKVRAMLTAGADANHQYAIGYRHPKIKTTVLIDAVKVGHAGIVQLLLMRGADPSVEGLLYGSENGLKYGTAIDAAESSQNAEIIGLLRNAVAQRILNRKSGF
ncbi:MAG TPA: ankyrin repeat domain-containing protein [Pyrinomonadaceae bacterium]|nr:ankyrin repeat domain-containing protein [Pyrinomonadaceae bacterium]